MIPWRSNCRGAARRGGSRRKPVDRAAGRNRWRAPSSLPLCPPSLPLEGWQGPWRRRKIRPCSRGGAMKRQDGRVDTLKVRDAKDVEQVVRGAIASDQPLEIIGHGCKRLIGQPMATNALLDLSALNAVTSYEPNELIITVQAGAPLADVKSLIDSKNQQFAFEPIDTAPLLGTPSLGTIGGMIGAGLAGPRRIKAGGARDHLLGAHGVSGFGDSFKAGGRVVKNVTGYDLCKLLAGSWGTLAVMTEVTLKVMPRPESERTLVLRGLDDVTANRAMTAALGSPFDVSGAAHVPDSAFRAAGGGLGDLGARREAVTLLRLEGISASAVHRAAALGKLLAPYGAAEIIEDAASAAVWASIRGVEPFADGGGGLIWAALPPKPDAHAALVRARVDAALGHAMLVRASEKVRRNVDVFHPQPAGLAALSERVRQSFDPKTILNRGRMMRGGAA